MKTMKWVVGLSLLFIIPTVGWFGREVLSQGKIVTELKVKIETQEKKIEKQEAIKNSESQKVHEIHGDMKAQKIEISHIKDTLGSIKRILERDR